MKVEREEVGKYQDTTLPVLRMGGVQNPQINWKENSRARIDRSAFTAVASNPGRWIVKFIENLSKEQNTEFICPQRRKEFWQTESEPSLCTSQRWKNAL